MSDAFDPYYIWLGVPPEDQPPNYYRLLGIELFEANREVIEAAANRQMAYMQEVSSGEEHIDEAQKILGELSRARICLLNSEKKAAYDAELRASFDALAAAAEPEPPATTPVADEPLMPPQFGLPDDEAGDDEAGESAAAPAVGLPQQPHAAKAKKQSSLGLIICLAVLALVLIVGGLLFYLSGEAEKQEQRQHAEVAEKNRTDKAAADKAAADEAAANRQAQEEAKQKATEEAERRAAEKAKKKAKEATMKKADEEAERRAAEKDKKKAEKEAKKKADEQKKTTERDKAIENLKTMGLVLESNQWKRVDEPYKRFKTALETFSKDNSDKSFKNLPMWRSLKPVLILQTSSKEHLQKNKETIATLCKKVPDIQPYTADQDQMLPPWVKEKAIEFIKSKKLVRNEKKGGWEISLPIKTSNKKKPHKQQINPRKLVEHQLGLMLQEFKKLEADAHNRSVDVGSPQYYVFDINNRDGEHRFFFLLENHPSPHMEYYRKHMGKVLKRKGQEVMLEAKKKAGMHGSIPKTDKKQIQTQPDRIQKQKQRLYRTLNSNKEIQTALKSLGSKLINPDN